MGLVGEPAAAERAVDKLGTLGLAKNIAIGQVVIKLTARNTWQLI